MVFNCMRHSILQMNGLDPYKMNKQDVDNTLKDILDESAAKFDFQQDTKPHTNHLLVSYKYIHDNGTVCGEQKVDTGTVEAYTNVAPGDNVFDALGNGGADGKVSVKWEKVKQKELKDLVAVAESCKKVLSPQLNCAKDLYVKVCVQD